MCERACKHTQAQLITILLFALHAQHPSVYARKDTHRRTQIGTAHASINATETHTHIHIAPADLSKTKNMLRLS